MRRGRPKKPDPFEWLKAQPEHVLNAQLGDNITALKEIVKQENERERRAEARSFMRVAYNMCGMHANAERRRKKMEQQRQLAEKYASLIANLSMSASSVAEHIKRNHPRAGLSARTLRAYVSDLRNKVGKARFSE